MNVKHVIKLLAVSPILYLLITMQSLADTPQTQDVPLFHNDDGLGLLQDCRFMRAIAVGEITEIPTSVNARSTNCLASIKSIVQVIYNVHDTNTMSTICIPSVEPDWFEVLEYVTAFMEDQASESLKTKSYGVWIMNALQEKYQCK